MQIFGIFFTKYSPSSSCLGPSIRRSVFLQRLLIVLLYCHEALRSGLYKINWSHTWAQFSSTPRNRIEKVTLIDPAMLNLVKCWRWVLYTVVRKRLNSFFIFLGAQCVESGVSCTDCYQILLVLIEIPAVPMGTKFSRWRPPNNRIFVKGTIFFGHSVHGSVHRKSNLTIFQKDANFSAYYISVGSSACFGCWHPSSGAHKTVITASGIDLL